MKHLSLKTQVVVAILLLSVLAAGSLLSYRIRREHNAALGLAYEQELLVLAELPRLRGRLRQLDLATDKFLLTGDELWLPTREAAVRGVRKDLSDLYVLLVDPHERRVLNELVKLLDPYLARQDEFIARRATDRLTEAEARAFSASKRSIEEIIDLMMTMKDISVEELESSRLRAKQASRDTFVLILGSGLAASAVVALCLFFLIIRPAGQLQKLASGWRLGQPWRPLDVPSGREIADLDRCMSHLSERLNEQYHLRTQLVSIVSHEFNNALNVLANVSFLLEETEADRGLPSRGHYYDMLNSHLRALTAVVNNLLNLGRLESGRFALTRRRVDLSTVLKDAIARLEILAKRKKQALLLELPESPAPVYADAEALSMVATNLLSNAIKYTPEGGSVTVAVKPRDGMVRVEFADTGIGIDDEDQKKIMEPFYRTQGGQAAAKGFGIGLSLTRQFLEAHDSKLEIASQRGKGSTFSFSLPAWKA